ncbi:hypothetical protein [Paenibacillus radicis (ex Xue et al. 2023)]|uniref:Uncharacterized protein n=1 Tax=Paenibacillus radicis (ex Xue et al. 2023) TaxID=2972489 RepID=A0ABT1YTX1_9BACL|nr:hypothetical protein [Paenibacillus radicis (ex Xue et al. 2023)]MCR8636633.1 hypothetical protein [Paenibacillus radicis (ex Xue et al. 2023)]
MQVHVKSIFTIRGKIAVGRECKLPSYNVNQDGMLLKVVLFPDENKIEVYYQSEMNEEDFEKNNDNQFSLKSLSPYHDRCALGVKLSRN